MTQKRLAFIFPGQGSQSVGMLKELANEFAIVEETFAEASEVLGYDLWQLVQTGPDNRLNETERTQPAVLAADIAVWRVWQQQHGPKPVVVAGHSLGEYAALVCAQALEFKTAVALVAARGRYMQAAVPMDIGAMAAIVGLTDEEVTAICQEAAQGQIAEPANFNAPGQVVVAGHVAAIERVVALAKPKGAKLAKRLPVSVPSHCSLMQGAAEQLSAYLQTITLATPMLPVIHNADVCSHTQVAAIKAILAKQLFQPVRWTQTIISLAAHSVDIVIECGPGKVLTGLNKRIQPGLVSIAIADPVTLQQTLQELI